MYGLPDTLRPLSAAEEQVMLAVWACPGAAARRDISQKLKATGWAAATVLNFLYRLEEKAGSGRQNRATATCMCRWSHGGHTECTVCGSGWTLY